MIVSRVTLGMEHRQTLVNLNAIRQRIQIATQQISSGLRVSQPSDGPIQAADIVETNSDVRTNTQFQTNLGNVNDELGSADASLNQAVNLLQRAQTLASQASNFNQTAETRTQVAGEVDGLIQNLITVANTSLGGKFLFSGSLQSVQPFVPNPASPDGVTYRGDQGRRSLTFPGGAQSPVSLDGQTIFLNPDQFTGAGRTAGTTGAATPSPPVGIGVQFSNGLTGSITADLPSFFVATAPSTVPGAGDQVTVSFASTDGAINRSITATLAGGETTAQIAGLLNAQAAADPVLNGKVTFSDSGGNLKLAESDTVGVGFQFTSTATGGLVTGLESGGAIGGESAEEIAAALNTQVAANAELSAAKVQFTAVSGQLQVTGNASFTFNAVDFSRGTGFVSGLAGQYAVGGADSANVFRVMTSLHTALVTNDTAGIENAIQVLQQAVDHISNVQSFYGAAQNQVLTATNSLAQTSLINKQRLSTLQDADAVQAASDLALDQTNEQAALQVAARESGRSLFDYLA